MTEPDVPPTPVPARQATWNDSFSQLDAQAERLRAQLPLPPPRLSALLRLGAPFGAFGGALTLLGVAIAALAIVAALVDWLLAADGRRVVARRVLVSEKLSLGAWNPVRLEVVNETSRSVR